MFPFPFSRASKSALSRPRGKEGGTKRRRLGVEGAAGAVGGKGKGVCVCVWEVEREGDEGEEEEDENERGRFLLLLLLLLLLLGWVGVALGREGVVDCFVLVDSGMSVG